MSRLSTHFAAAFAAVLLTAVSMQIVTSVPPSQLALIDAPAIA